MVRRTSATPPLDDKAIDTLYGLEPVYEPSATSAAASGATQFVTLQCPYCGEQFDSAVDTSAGSTRYIEDCQICCRPIEVQVEIDEGTLTGVNAQRTD